MTRPLLAICIPTYNRSEPLGRLLDRLHAELGGATDVVVLVADNASPDGTPELLAGAAERMPSLQVHRQPENLGALRNTRWLVANAPDCEYLWMFGDDDEPEPGAVAYACELLRAHGPAWLHLPHRFVHPDGSIKAESRLPAAPEVYADPGRMYLEQTHWLTFLSASIVRRDDLRRVEAVSSTDNLYFPLIWSFRASLDGPCVVADRLLVTASADVSWGDRMAEVMTRHFIGLYDEAIGRLASAEEFGRSLGRELGDSRCISEVRAASAAAGDDATARALVAEGEAAFGAGDAAAAAELFTRALEESPAFAEAWNDLAVALHAMGSPQARVAVATAVELDPTDENAWQNHVAITGAAA